jgi:LysR family transcriptional regulator, benzoate and cis,cis-muconate-responsive activator of ben and cat genes
MELRHLRYFVAVAEVENVSRAALALHVSQPAVSRQIRDLENELGFALLKRDARSVRLTEAGRVFLPEARAVLQRVADAVETARAIAVGGRGELHIGYAPSPTVRILPATLRAFQAQLPKVRVRLHDLSTEEMLAGLREGKLQMAFLVRPTHAMMRGLRFEELTRDSMCLAVPPAHPFARLRSVPLARAAKEPFVAFTRKDYPEYHEYVTALFGIAKSQPHSIEEHDSATSLVAAVEAGSGVALVPRSLACSAGPRLKLIALTPPPPPLVIGLAWTRDGLTDIAEQFLKSAKETAAKSGSQELQAAVEQPH